MAGLKARPFKAPGIQGILYALEEILHGRAGRDLSGAESV
jgi:hypothetical protein